MLSSQKLRKEIRAFADPIRAEGLKRFFKTKKGEYGEGDKFLGVMVPETRSVAMKYKELPITQVGILLKSKWHEERLCALVILVLKFQDLKTVRGLASHSDDGDGDRKKIFDLYLISTKFINNWDLIDVTAHKIVGDYLVDKPRDILYKLARSNNLWERRISIIASWAFISRGQFKDTLKLSELMLQDDHDLIHKAIGWMLREVGKKDVKALENFLNKHAAQMPRTMLRYAIEKLPERDRQKYLAVKRPG